MKKIFWIALIFCLITPLCVYAIDGSDFDADKDGDVDGEDLAGFAEYFGKSCWYKDYDGDFYSDGNKVWAVSRPEDYYLESELTATSGDCDDTIESMNPGMNEICEDSFDNDCDGATNCDDTDCDANPVCAASCGEDPTPPGGVCPGICTGGCTDGRCIIDCTTPSACSDLTIICPPGFSCEVDCYGDAGCADATINCPDQYSCVVDCAQGSGACENAYINCSTDGTCTLLCGPQFDACRNTNLNCGNDACTAICSSCSPPPTVNCGNSCDCNP